MVIDVVDGSRAFDDPDMATHIVDIFNENYGTHWLAISNYIVVLAFVLKSNLKWFSFLSIQGVPKKCSFSRWV